MADGVWKNLGIHSSISNGKDRHDKKTQGKIVILMKLAEIQARYLPVTVKRLTEKRQEKNQCSRETREMLQGSAGPESFLLFISSETGSCQVVQAGLRLAILLLQLTVYLGLQAFTATSSWSRFSDGKNFKPNQRMY